MVEPVLHYIVTSAGIDKISKHPQEEVAGEKGRGLDVNIPFGKSLVIVCKYPVRAIRSKPVGPAYGTPIAIRRTAFTPKMYLKGRPWRSACYISVRIDAA